MEKLINKLENIYFAKLDIDEVLDDRDSKPFDSEWTRVYNDVESLKKEKGYSIEEEEYSSSIREKVFKKVHELSGDCDLAGYISDDFGLIIDSKLLNYSDEWLSKMIDCYKHAIIPTGNL